MEPPVVAGCQGKGDLIILIIIFPNVNIIPVTADIVEGYAFERNFFLLSLPADIAAFNQFFFDLYKILFLQGDRKRGLHRLKMGDLILYLFCEGSKRFKGTLQFIILLEIFLGIFRGGKLRLQGDRDHFPGIIIQSFHGGGTGLNTIAIGI